MKLSLLCTIPLAAALLLNACATNPVTGGQDFVLMSEEQEISLGRQSAAEIAKEMPPYDDAALNALVQKVGEKLAAHSHRPGLIYRFTVVDSTQVNAFALPGGYIYITRGLLAYLNSEAELAAVLGHEIGHVTARHSVRQHSTATVTGVLGAVLAASTGIQGMDSITNLAGTALVRGYGREHELEADRLGAEYLAKSGYDPQGMLEVVRVLKNQELFDQQTAKQENREPNAYHGLFSTHPDNDTRLKEVINAAEHLRVPGNAQTGHDEFLQALDGLIFGPGEDAGIVRDNHFYHRKLDLAIDFPAGWRIDNQSERIIATSPANDALLLVTMTDLNKRTSAEQFMKDRLQLADMRQGTAFMANGFSGYTAIATGKTPWGTRAVRYIVLFRDTRAWIFAGATKEAASPAPQDAAIRAAAASFRKLAASEQQLARAQHLKIIRAAADASYANLARTSPIANYPEQQLRLLNGQYPDGKPVPGSWLKIVQ